MIEVSKEEVELFVEKKIIYPKSDSELWIGYTKGDRFRKTYYTKNQLLNLVNWFYIFHD